MTIPRLIIWIVSVGLIGLCAGVVSGQNYPNKPIRIVTSAPGGQGDIITRFIQQGISGSLGQPVIVENRSASILGAEIVKQAAPDGYTLFITGSTLWTDPLFRKVPYDLAHDFAPISLLALSPVVLVVHPSVPVKTVKELIAFAKARPGGLNYAAASVGSSAHLAGEMLKAQAGINMVGVYYSAAGPAITSLLGGEVQLIFTPLVTVATHVASGRLHALASAGLQRSSLVPDLPTVAETFPGFEMGTPIGMWVPAKTPKVIIDRLNQEVVRVLNDPEVKQKFGNMSAETVPSSPEQFLVVVKSDVAKTGKLIKDLGITTQ